MENTNKGKLINRREFINSTLRLSLGIAVGGLAGSLLLNAVKDDMVWQLDSEKCIQCGQCTTGCVLSISAVKCVHVHDMCGYCDLCGGFFRPEVKNLTTGAENQLCPTGAIKRTFIEDPFFEYDIDEDLCIGCGKCVAGCRAFGNGSLQLQVKHDLCLNCNKCSIARTCPAEAFSQVSVNEPSLFNGFMSDSLETQ